VEEAMSDEPAANQDDAGPGNAIDERDRRLLDLLIELAWTQTLRDRTQSREDVAPST
jgi:hypothetical protein